MNLNSSVLLLLHGLITRTIPTRSFCCNQYLNNNHEKLKKPNNDTDSQMKQTSNQFLTTLFEFLQLLSKSLILSAQFLLLL